MALTVGARSSVDISARCAGAARFNLDRRRLVSLDSVRALVGDSASTAVAATTAQRSITLAKDSLSLVPMATQGAAAPRVLVTNPSSSSDRSASRSVARETPSSDASWGSGGSRPPAGIAPDAILPASLSRTENDSLPFTTAGTLVCLTKAVNSAAARVSVAREPVPR